MNGTVKKILFTTINSLGAAFWQYQEKKIETESIRKILIVCLHGLGDVFYISSVLPLIHERFPSAMIDVWVHSRSAEVLMNNPYIHEQYIYDEIVTRRDIERLHIDYKNRRMFINKMRENLYDIAIDLSWVWGATLMLKAIKPRILVGGSQHGLDFMYDIHYPYYKLVHLPLCDIYYDILRQTNLINLSNEQSEPHYYMSNDAQNNAKDIFVRNNIKNNNPIISIHLTAGWKEKEWDLRNYLTLIERLYSNYNILIIGKGERDMDKYRKIHQSLPNVINGIDNTLDTTVGMLSLCLCHIGGDSFPMHLASSLNIPVICIAGPTNPLLFSPPIKNNVIILYHQLFCSSPENERYCTRNAGRSCATLDCMTMISVDNVYDAIMNIQKSQIVLQ